MEKITVDFCALHRVVSYLENDEKRHYEEYDKKPKKHIWTSIKKLKHTIEHANMIDEK